jgi:hypothetical protein
VNPVQSRHGGEQDAFAAKISADGQRLFYSTPVGGSADEWGYAVALDSEGNLIAVGQTASQNFSFGQSSAGIQALPHHVRSTDAYIMKISPALDPPPLTIGRSGNNIILSWPKHFAGFTLEHAPGAGDALWQPVSEAARVQGNNHTVIIRLLGETRFYRLRHP